MTGLFKSQRGAVALVTTIIVAVLISIITISLSDVLTTEQRQTTDVHNSERAYYAADAGVEDALARIRHYADLGCVYEEDETGQATVNTFSSDTSCNVAGATSFPYALPGVVFPNLSNNCTVQNDATNNYRRYQENGVYSACWTKRTVTRVTDQFNGTLVPDNDLADIKAGQPYSAVADFSNAVDNQGAAASVKYIQVEWGDYNDGSPARCDLQSNSAEMGMPEITIVQFDPAPTQSGLKIYRGMGMPANGKQYSDASLAANDYNPAITYGCGAATSMPNQGSLPLPAAGAPDALCSANNTDYSVSGTNASQYLPNWKYCRRYPVDSTKLYMLRIRAKFNSVKYKATAWSTSSGTDTIGLAQDHVRANYDEISVTGRAGDTYRRLIVRKQLNADVFSVFDFVLFSEDDLNKNESCINVTDPTQCTGS